MRFRYVSSFGLNNIPRGLFVCVLRIFVHVQVQFLLGDGIRECFSVC